MNDAEKLLRAWKQNPPSAGAKEADALKVMNFLGLTVVRNNQNHYQASHDALKGHPRYPFGMFTINCHAGGKQGQAHPKAIKDIVSVAAIIQAAQEKDRQNDETNTN